MSRRGELIAEHYASGVRPGALANVKSASKSIIAALVGIAIERGLIKSVREPIVTYFPELRRDPDRRKQAITVEDLLTMRSGLESTSGRNYGAWVRSRNWVRYALGQPMVSEPGTGDGVQHRQHAPALRHPHQGDRHQHVAVRPGRAGEAASASAWPAGRRIRRASISAATRCC